MIKTLGMSMLACIALVPFQANAQTMNLKLAPNQSKTISNSYMWTINATCTIQTNDSKKTLVVNALKNNSQVNGKHLSSGQKTSVTVHNNDNISVSAEPGAQVTIFNSSVDSVVASCST
ncbi:MAG: hypothetical protein Q8R83_07805 [Legionellaceae bacterium]|nr:hypothetical protein [Legionellaceae bacterium]